MKNWILAALLAAFSALALAQTPPPAARGSADESAVVDSSLVPSFRSN